MTTPPTQQVDPHIMAAAQARNQQVARQLGYMIMLFCVLLFCACGICTSIIPGIVAFGVDIMNWFQFA